MPVEIFKTDWLDIEPAALIERRTDEIAAKLAARLTAKLITVPIAAGMICSTEKALRHMIDRRTIPASIVRRIGRRVMLDRKEFERWIDSQV